MTRNVNNDSLAKQYAKGFDIDNKYEGVTLIPSLSRLVVTINVKAFRVGIPMLTVAIAIIIENFTMTP